MLKARVGQHATSMQDLVRAVVLLDRDTVKSLGERIADHHSAPDTIDSADSSRQISSAWKAFAAADLGSESEAFAAAARELALAAGTAAYDVVADRFAAVSRACVQCHRRYVTHDHKINPIDTGPPL